MLRPVPAARLGPEVQGILLILHLPSDQTDPADLWDQAHHLHPGEIKSVSGTVGIQMKQMRHRPMCKVDTYSGTGCSYRSLRASGTRWTLRRRRDTSIKTREFRSKNGSTSQLTLEMNNNSHVLLCHLCFLSGRALRSLPAERKKRQQCENGDGRNPRFKATLG